MNAQQDRVLQSLRRVQGWFAANPQYAAQTPALESLNAVVRRATHFGTQQDTQFAQSQLISRDERAQRRELMTIYMGRIAKVARALQGTVPGIGVLSMPKWSLESAALVAAATAMARKAEIYKPVLVENGLPADVVEQLDAAATRLKASLDARGLARAARKSATKGVEAELALGRRLVDIIEANLIAVLQSDPPKLAEWRHLRRVTQRGTATRAGSTAAEGSPTLVESSPTAVEASPTTEPRAA